jgi:hypothetical protein
MPLTSQKIQKYSRKISVLRREEFILHRFGTVADWNLQGQIRFDPTRQETKAARR